MKILFDQGTPVPLRRALSEHSVDTAFERGWSAVENGELLSLAEQESYDLLITTDQNLRDQQNLSLRRIAVIVLLSTSWPRTQLQTSEIVRLINTIHSGDYAEIPV